MGDIVIWTVCGNYCTCVCDGRRQNQCDRIRIRFIGRVCVHKLRIWLTVLSVWLAQKQTDSWEQGHQQHRINSGVGLYSSAVSNCVCDWHRCNQCDTEDVTIHLEGRPAFLNVLHWEYWDFLPDTVNSLSGHEHLHSNKMIFFILLASVIFCTHLHFHLQRPTVQFTAGILLYIHETVPIPEH